MISFVKVWQRNCYSACGGAAMNNLIPIERLENKIYFIRGQKVMLDLDLARLYGVETRLVKRAVRRNLKRFPEGFMFILSDEEIELMVSHFGIPSRSYFGGSRPFAFTEHGILMLSCVLNSERAINVSIQIMRAFVRLRQILSTHRELAQKLAELEQKVEHHDSKITAIFDAIKKLMSPPRSTTGKIGFVK
jgi:hypothetical protein